MGQIDCGPRTKTIGISCRATSTTTKNYIRNTFNDRERNIAMSFYQRVGLECLACSTQRYSLPSRRTRTGTSRARTILPRVSKIHHVDERAHSDQNFNLRSLPDHQGGALNDAISTTKETQSTTQESNLKQQDWWHSNSSGSEIQVFVRRDQTPDCPSHEGTASAMSAHAESRSVG
jgi:hypothetical protein